MGKKHLTIIASALALIVGCAAKPEPIVFKNTQTGGIVDCRPISCPRDQPTWFVILAVLMAVDPKIDRCATQDYVDSCVRALTEAGWVRLTGDGGDGDECRRRATDPDGTLVSARFSDCMNDTVRRRR